MATPFLFQPNTVDLPDPQCINLWLRLVVKYHRVYDKKGPEKRDTDQLKGIT